MPASRTTAFKGLYFGMMFGAAASYWVAAFYFHLPMIAMVLLIPAFFIPGRILGFFWRDLLRGSHLLNQKRYAESKSKPRAFWTNSAGGHGFGGSFFWARALTLVTRGLWR